MGGILIPPAPQSYSPLESASSTPLDVSGLGEIFASTIGWDIALEYAGAKGSGKRTAGNRGGVPGCGYCRWRSGECERSVPDRGALRRHRACRAGCEIRPGHGSRRSCRRLRRSRSLPSPHSPAISGFPALSSRPRNRPRIRVSSSTMRTRH